MVKANKTDAAEAAKIHVVVGQPLRDKTQIVSGSIKIRDLCTRHVIPYLDPITKEGYQRKPANARIRSFANDLRADKGDVPTAILVNLRKKSASTCYEPNGTRGKITLKKNDKVEFHIVDGQHRILAFKTLFEENPEKWGDRKIQFVCMLGASPETEMRQFYTVNSTAKSVKTDLAYDIITQMAKANPALNKAMLASGSQWKIKGQQLAELLNSGSVIWKNKIRLANADKKDTILPVASLVNSLKTLNKSSYFGKLSIEKQFKIIEAYWKSIKKVCPDPFGADQQSYSLQKGLGVTVLHELLAEILIHLKNEGKSPSDSKSYIKLMKPVLENLSQVDTDGDEISGADFWLAARYGGAAGAYSSSSGQRLLLAKLEAELPEMEI